jgi:hypothetical protein
MIDRGVSRDNVRGRTSTQDSELSKIFGDIAASQSLDALVAPTLMAAPRLAVKVASYLRRTLRRARAFLRRTMSGAITNRGHNC